MSLGQKYEEYMSSGEDENWDEPEGNKQVLPFFGKGVSMAGDVEVNYEKFNVDSQDVEMLSMLKFSI